MQVVTRYQRNDLNRPYHHKNPKNLEHEGKEEVLFGRSNFFRISHFQSLLRCNETHCNPVLFRRLGWRR